MKPVIIPQTEVAVGTYVFLLEMKKHLNADYNPFPVLYILYTS